MSEILALIGPLFTLIGVGWLAVRHGLFAREHLPALGRFVIALCIPALLWRNLGQRNPAEVLHPAFLLAYALASLLALGAGLLWGRARGQDRAAAAMSGMGMSCANTGFVGFPLASQLVGADATVALALVMLVENLLMLPLCLALADSAAARHAPLHHALGRALWALKTNPIVIGIALGLATGALRAQLGWALPQPLDRAITLMAGASAAVSLFYIGGSLVGLQIGGLKAQVAAVAAGKLLLHPLATLALLGLAEHLLGPLPPALRWSAVVMAAAPMLGIYPILGARYGLQTSNAACSLGATLASFATLALWIAALRWAWGAPQG